ncbi:molybdenum cofactor sulfurase [Anaeramoeba flamelloides]|uniref:Molybdenum cofactor sulfurase n=1 Tax=Anaeramoeba flamelloides TaxID=1746091 RepID=A0AAV7Y921_9EUKA|nr:molybdenum cofactor sulfurase [Anaeramoeba flamelloides]
MQRKEKKEKRQDGIPKPHAFLYLLPVVILVPFLYQEFSTLFRGGLTNANRQNANGLLLGAENKKPFLFEKEKMDEYHSPELKEEFLQRFGDDYGYDGEIEKIVSKELSRLEECYMDYTGAALYPHTVIEKSFRDLANNVYGNPHSRSPSSKRSERALSHLRGQIRDFLNADPEEYSIVFTSGTTEALKMIGESFPWSKESKFVYLKRSHNSVVGVREYAKDRGNGFFSIDEEDVLNWQKKTWKKILKTDQVSNNYEDYGNNNLKHNGEEDDEEEEILEFQTQYKSNIQAHYGDDDDDENGGGKDKTVYHLFSYPAESNFDGAKFDLNWINKFQDNPPVEGTNWMVLLDAAAFLPTHKLDLEKNPADFVAISLYKMFGYPTGLGALIARNEAIKKLEKSYWGGGTILLTSSDTDFCVLHPNPSTKFEDGTVPFLEINSAKYGFEFLNSLGMKKINRHVYSLTRFLYEKLNELTWSNGAKVVKIYGKWKQEKNGDVQGGIISFNTLDQQGQFIGYNIIDDAFSKHGIHIRSGCLCNPGSCSKYFGIDDKDRNKLITQKEGCGDDIYTVNNKWLGTARISLGYLSTFEDVEYFLYIFKNKILTQFE